MPDTHVGCRKHFQEAEHLHLYVRNKVELLLVLLRIIFFLEISLIQAPCVGITGIHIKLRAVITAGNLYVIVLHGAEIIHIELAPVVIDSLAAMERIEFARCIALGKPVVTESLVAEACIGVGT